MTIKTGTLRNEKFTNETDSEVKVVKIVEKTDGNYSEVLVCVESTELHLNGNVIPTETSTTFEVYADMTFNSVLALLNLNNYTWTQPLIVVNGV